MSDQYFISQQDGRTIVAPTGLIIAVAKRHTDAVRIVNALNRPVFAIEHRP